MKKLILAAAVCAFGVVAYGSHITSVTENGSTCSTSGSCGSADNVVNFTGFATDGTDMGGMVITASFVGGVGNGNCTWSVFTSGCSTASFSIAYPAADTTDPDNANPASVWTITNLSSVALSSIAINAYVGNTSFQRCLVTTGPQNAGTHTFDDLKDGLNNNYGNTVCNTIKVNNDFAVSASYTPCGAPFGGQGANPCTDGTAGGAYGWSVGDNGPTGAAGTATGVTAIANYTNLLTDPSHSTPVGDEWGAMTLTFGGTAFSTANSTFTFRADTDSIAAPEPATIGLVGLALLGLGGLRLRRRSS